MHTKDCKQLKILSYQGYYSMQNSLRESEVRAQSWKKDISLIFK